MKGRNISIAVCGRLNVEVMQIWCSSLLSKHCLDCVRNVAVNVGNDMFLERQTALDCVGECWYNRKLWRLGGETPEEIRIHGQWY